MPSSLESEELIVTGHDAPDYARNKTSLPPLAAAIDPSVPIGRLGGKRSSSGRRSSRQDPLDRLRALPQIRPIPWYPGKELPPEKSTLSDRVQTRSACLMASRGRANIPPCSHCATGLGRFSMCISLDDFLSGACSTCHLAARGNSCSIRLKVASDTQSQIDRQEEQSQSPQGRWDRRGRSQQSSSQPEPEPAPESSAEPQNPPRIRGAKEGRQRLPTATTSWTPVEPQQASAGSLHIPVEASNSNLKRKREALQGTDVWKPYVSPYRPVEPPTRNAQAPSGSRSSFTSADASRDELPLLNYIYRKDVPVNGAAQHNDASTTSSPANSHPSRDRIWGSTTETSTRATPASNEYANHSAPRDASASMSPSDQLFNQQPTRSIEPAEPRHASGRGKGAGSRPSARETAFIDTLPRKKQSQIYDLIDSLQGGIGDCQKQAENMQKQLDSLKAMMGIGKESNNGAMGNS